jgi:hypothetical protein
VTTILHRIDNVLRGVCPCGADPRPGSAYCSADCVPDRRAGAPFARLERFTPPGGRHSSPSARRCVHCGQRTPPRRGRRGLPAPGAGEDCDLCGHCGRDFPGTRIVTTVFPVGDADAWGWTMRLGDISATRYLSTADLAEYRDGIVEWTLDRLEAKVLRDYARRHPERPGAAAWLAAHTARERHEREVRANQIRAHQLAGSLIDPRTLLHRHNSA